MNLPVQPPLLPMLAKRVEALPSGDTWIFEPKWDGFRTLVFRDRNEILIQSRDQKSLNRYFPELIDPLRRQLPARCVLDGEIVIVDRGGIEFESLQLRLHPAASRVRRLAQEIPASIVFFDLLCIGNRDVRGEAFRNRRQRLESILASAEAPIHLTPATRDPAVAADWFSCFEGAGFDGVIAKQSSGNYQPNKRVMLKLKHQRDCDCVVAGFRWHKTGGHAAVGSLLLGLYDEQRVLHHVGVCSSFTESARRDLVKKLRPYRREASTDHPWRDPHGNRAPGTQSRWNAGKDLSWEPLRPELVIEVEYDHMAGKRFRHIAQFRRWRPDKNPRECTFAQLEVVPPRELLEIFEK